MSEATPEATPAQEAPAEEAPKPAEQPKAEETDWKAEARKWETRAKDNKSEADKLTEAQQAHQNQLDAIAKALGLKSDDAPADPAKLTADIAAAQSDARDARQQLAVYKNAAANEANPDALLDSASFLRSIKDIDPTDAAAVNAAIKAAVDANPGFKSVPPVPVAPNFGGGPRTPAGRPDPGPGLPRLAAAYAENSK